MLSTFRQQRFGTVSVSKREHDSPKVKFTTTFWLWLVAGAPARSLVAS